MNCHYDYTETAAGAVNVKYMGRQYWERMLLRTKRYCLVWLVDVVMKFAEAQRLLLDSHFDTIPSSKAIFSSSSAVDLLAVQMTPVTSQQYYRSLYWYV